MLLSTKIDKIDFRYDLVILTLFLLCSFAFLFNLYSLSYNTTLYAFIFFYVKNLTHVVRSKLNSIDLYIIFFVFYFLCGFILFNSQDFVSIISNFFLPEQRGVFKFLNTDNLIKINYTYFVALLPFIFLFNKKSTERSLLIKPIFSDKIKLSAFSSFCSKAASIYIIFIFLPFILFIYIRVGGEYAFISDSIDQRYVNLLGFGCLVISALIPFCNIHKSYKDSKWFTILIIILSFAILKIHFRMLSAMVLICLLINLELRGFKIKFKHFLILFVIFFAITIQSLFRVKNFNFDNSTAVIFGILGEFFLSQFYFVAVLINPHGYELQLVNHFDFILQMFPSAIRPESAIFDFMSYNYRYGLDAAPVGGLSLIGQAILYFQYFYPVFLWLIALYLLFFQKIINQRIPHILLAGFPISLMILPRGNIWLLRNFLIGVLIILMLKLVFLSLIRLKKNSKEGILSKS